MAESISEIEAKLKADPDNRELKLGLLAALLEREIYGFGVEDKEQGLDEEGPDRIRTIVNDLDDESSNANVQYARALVSLTDKNYEECIEAISDCFRIRCDGGKTLTANYFQTLIYERFNINEEFWKRVTHIIEKYWPNSSAAYHSRALNEKKATVALKLNMKALSQDELFWPAALDNAEISLDLRKWADAKTYAEQVIRCVEEGILLEGYDIYWAHNYAARALHGLRHYREEEEALEKCIELGIELGYDNLDVICRLIRNLITQDKLTKALSHAESGLAKEPQNTDLLSAQVHIQRRLGDGKAMQSTLKDVGGDVSTGSSSSYLLTWNPNKFPWFDHREYAEEAQKHGYVISEWSCGRTKRIKPGDHLFMLRQGKEPRGLIAYGRALSEVVKGNGWSKENRSAALYVIVEWEMLLNSNQQSPLATSRLKEDFPSVNWNTQISGITIEDAVSSDLFTCWKKHLETIENIEPEAMQVESRLRPDEIIPEEVGEGILYPEGAIKRIQINAHERNVTARKACIAHHGTVCVVCEFNFGKTYGELGEGFIHVHHIKPLSASEAVQQVDPRNDLVPVCPNCHAMLHRKDPPLTISELKKILHPTLN